MTAGRPTKYRKSYCKALIEAGKQGLSLTAFAGTIEVARDTLSEWRERHPDFSDAIRVHAGVRTLFLERQLMATESGARVAAMSLALKNSAPNEWREKQTIEANVNMTIADLVAASYKPPALIEHKKDEDEQ